MYSTWVKIEGKIKINTSNRIIFKETEAGVVTYNKRTIWKKKAVSTTLCFTLLLLMIYTTGCSLSPSSFDTQKDSDSAQTSIDTASTEKSSGDASDSKQSGKGNNETTNSSSGGEVEVKSATDKSTSKATGAGQSSIGGSEELAQSTDKGQSSNKPSKTEKAVDKLLPDKVENKVSAIASKKVSAEDLFEVIKIVGKNLGIKDIKFLFDSAKSDYWETTSVEEIEKARSILFTKLDDSDLSALSNLGKKYGRSMEIINKNIDVAETKENLMRSKGLID